MIWPFKKREKDPELTRIEAKIKRDEPVRRAVERRVTVIETQLAVIRRKRS